MNPENGGNAVKNSGEGGEKIVKPETIKELGDRTVDLEGYLAEDEQKANESKEKTEQEQNANKSLAISDRAYVLENGKIVLSGTGEELLASEDIKKAYLGG